MTRTTRVPSISKASDRKMFMMNGRSSSTVSMSERTCTLGSSSSAGSHQIIIPSKKTPSFILAKPVRRPCRAPLSFMHSLRPGCLPSIRKLQIWRTYNRCSKRVIELCSDSIHEVQESESMAHLLRTRPGGVLLKKDSGARTTAPRRAVCIS